MYAENAVTTRSRLHSSIVPHTQYVETMTALQELYDARVEEKYVDGFCLKGKSGAGKTVIKEQFIAKYPPYETEDRTVIPIVHIVMPTAGGGKALYQAILNYIGAATTGTEADLETRCISLMRECGTIILVVDEGQHMVSRKGRGLNQMRAGDNLKNLMNGAKICVVLIGTEEIEDLLKANGQLRRRFSTVRTLRTWNPEEESDLREVAKILSTLLAMAKSNVDYSNLLNTEFVTQFAYATGGRMAYMVKLLGEATTIAEKACSAKLTASHFETAFAKVVWENTCAKTNPFSCDFEEKVLDGFGQPFAEDGL